MAVLKKEAFIWGRICKNRGY